MRTTSKRIAYAALVLGALFAFILIFSSLPVNAAETKVTFVHFADYHSHAVPFYSEGKVNQGGLARTIAYLKQAKASLPNPIILNGGDTMNSGTPSWSDKYQCTEWPMFNGLLDAMAVGNHEFDYGWDAFLKCRDSARYPIISANLIYSTTNQPVLLSNNKPYAVKQVGDVKIGLFALSGPDFARLVSRKNLADNVTFGENLATAKQIVSALRNEEKVNAVVLFGHEDRESDFAMAQQLPGIDLILGTHSHFKGELQKIEGTNTYFISPFQYLTYLSQVEMTFTDGKVSNVTGKLVKMDESITPDPTVDAQIAQMQKDLEADPKYAPKFVKIGQASVELSVEGIDKGESVLGDFVMDILRRTAKANAAFSTASSFRASIPPGPVRMEDYLTALPYKNVIMVYDLTGAQVKDLLDYSVSKIGSDNFSATSGLRYDIVNGKVGTVQILKDAENEQAGYEPLDSAKTFKVMTTDFQGKIAGGYKDIFAKASAVKDTGLIVNDVLIDFFVKNSPVSAKLDGRVGSAAAVSQPVATPPPVPTPPSAPAQPSSTAAQPPWLTLAVLGGVIALIAGGLILLRKK